MKKPYHQFRIVFEGDVEKVDVNVLIATLLSTTNVLNEISKEIDSKQKLSIQIEPFAPGSFEIIHSLAQSHVFGDLIANITRAETVEYLAALVTILSGVYGVKKFLKGKKPKSTSEAGDNIHIIAGDGSSITVDKKIFNIYGKNPIVNDGINKTFKSLEENEQISEFKLLSEGGKCLFTAEKKDFVGMREKNELIEEDLEIITVPEAKLSLHKIVFTQVNKWGFIYEGNKISAFIRDDEFFVRLEEHDFKIGDYFIAELRIIRIYDPTIKAYINEGYEVLKIKEHIKMAAQQKLNF